MGIPKKIEEKVRSMLSSGDMPQRRPALKANRESNISGLFVIGDLAGAPVIKLAMAQGVEVAEHIAAQLGSSASEPGLYDVAVIGAGAAGLNAALCLQERGLRTVVLEKSHIASTIEDFPEGKWVYAEPDQTPPQGKLWLDGARKEDLIARWHQIIEESRLEVHTGEALQSLARQHDGTFALRTEKAGYRARRAILATGQRGNPRWLGVRGEDREAVYHRLYGPRHYVNEEILVVGGGNSAVEAALTLAERNRVRLSYRGDSFHRIFKDNERKLNKAVAEGRVELLLKSNVREFGEACAEVEIDRDGRRETVTIPCHHVFVLVGAELPVKFLKSLGIRMENEWTGSLWQTVGLVLALMAGLWFWGGHAADIGGISFHLVPRLGGLALAAAALAALVVLGFRGSRFAWLGVSFLVWYTVYGVKSPGAGMEFWPYRNWGFQALSFFGRPPTFWYTVLYTALMTIFGVEAVKRWGLDRKDKFQIWRYVSLLSFQWVFFFLIPEFLFEWAVKYQWVGVRLAHDPAFAGQAWRSYGIIYAWPLFFYTFFYDPSKIWVIWGVLLTFGIIPVFVLFHGKRYCSWICGCGGLAETFGDRWRHLAPKGRASIRWEWMNLAILIFAGIVTAAMLLRDALTFLRQPATLGLTSYHLIADIWLVGILPVTLYPFLGGKVWCRYWCPLAKMMHLLSRFYTRLGISRFRIRANDKCIGCMECTRNCQVGIDVMSFALRQEDLTNANSSCIGCGICVTVCPMDVLDFRGRNEPPKLVQIAPGRAAI